MPFRIFSTLAAGCRVHCLLLSCLCFCSCSAISHATRVQCVAKEHPEFRPSLAAAGSLPCSPSCDRHGRICFSCSYSFSQSIDTDRQRKLQNLFPECHSVIGTAEGFTQAPATGH
jgi:hypothetical protein